MSLAWCPKCEHLTNDPSKPCFQCGGPLEGATIDMDNFSVNKSVPYKMEIVKRKRKWHIDWYFQWIEWPLFKQYSWCNFDFCHIGFEHTRFHRRGEWEFTFIVLGIGATITTWLTGDSLITELEEQAKTVMSHWATSEPAHPET